jgi:hypothetical protein
MSYYLFAGTSSEEQQHMHLLDNAMSQYLGQHGSPGSWQIMCNDDTQQFEQLKLALKNVGFSKCQQCIDNHNNNNNNDHDDCAAATTWLC